MDYKAYQEKYFVNPAPEPRFQVKGIFGATLFFHDFERAAGYYKQVLGPPAYIEGENTLGWRIGSTWLTLLRAQAANPSNVEINIVTETPQEAERLQGAFIAAGGTGQEPIDNLMYEPLHMCPVRDPFGTEILISSSSG